MAFDLYQRHTTRPLTQLVEEWVDNSKMYNLLGPRVEVVMPPFLQNVQYDQAINKYQKVCLMAIVLPHVEQ